MAEVQEQNTVAIFIYLVGQTIALWKKLSKIEQQLRDIKEHNDEQDKKINNALKIIIEKFPDAAQRLIP